MGIVVSLHIAPSAAAPMISVPEVKGVSGRGLEGDRYFTRLGTYSNTPGSGREVTLIELEAIDALERDYEIALEPGHARRNIVVRGVPLNHLVGQVFSIGAVVLRGARLCEPCGHLEKLTSKKVLRAMIHRGGLRAEIVTGGMLHNGDAIDCDLSPDR
jgi:MOSC domain-containing protein YiiM